MEKMENQRPEKTSMEENDENRRSRSMKLEYQKARRGRGSNVWARESFIHLVTRGQHEHTTRSLVQNSHVLQRDI